MYSFMLSLNQKDIGRSRADYDKFEMNCAHSFTEQFHPDVFTTDDYEMSRMNDAFQKLNYGMQRLFKNAGKFEDLT